MRIGDYVVERALAGDGMVAECLARHALLPRRAHVRVIAAQARSLAVRMMREAWVLEALDHPGVPRLYECGVLADGRPWIAFEPIVGETLVRGCSDALAVMRAVAEVLAHAHARGIAHRAVRAEAIVVREPGKPVCLVDWRHASVDGEGWQDDLRALGAIAAWLLVGTKTVPRRLAELVDAMRADAPPAAADVAAALASSFDEDDVVPVVEEIVLADPADTLHGMPRVRWTPPQGVKTLVPPGVPLARVARR